MRRLGIYGAVVLAVISVALAAAAAGRDFHRASASSSAQLQSSAKEQMYIGRDDKIRAGEKLFRRHCVECHGADGRGIGKAANLRAPEVQTKSPAELVEYLRNGNLWRGMPSWAGMPEERRWQIVAYLKTLRVQ
jgi:mono/diheme cytochrome c family protein